MNEKRYNLKKLCAIVDIGYIVSMVLFSLIAHEQIQNSLIGPYYILVFAGVFALIVLYGLHLQRCEKAGKETLGLNFIHTIAKYEFLLEQLVMRDFKIKYKRSVLGVFWSFLNPLLMMLVQYVVFSKLFGVRGMSVEHYAIYLLCGIVMFNGFNDCTSQAMRAITSNSSLITKVYVPKYIYPVSKVLSSSINIFLSMVPLLLVTFVYGLFNGLYLTPAILLLPVALFFLILFIMGMGFLLSSLMVFFHDVEFLWGVITTMWMYATPIIYDIKMLEGTWVAKILVFNPLYHYVDFVREIILYGRSPEMIEYVVCFAFSFGMFLIGAFVFKKTQDKFVLYI
ncbi:MAG: ABC transporter permease [Lachnospiraceae bacterium]